MLTNKGRHNKFIAIYAMKKVNISQLNSKERDNALNEITLLNGIFSL